jgi:hypothetical protein
MNGPGAPTFGAARHTELNTTPARAALAVRAAYNSLVRGAQCTPTILNQISVEKTKISERLARLDTDRAAAATRLTDLETAERVLSRVSKTPPSRRTTSASPAEAKAQTASRGRRRPSREAASRSAGRKPSAPSLGERVLALATGKTRQELYRASPNDRPNHVGIAVQRHLRAGRIQERDG